MLSCLVHSCCVDHPHCMYDHPNTACSPKKKELKRRCDQEEDAARQRKLEEKFTQHDQGETRHVFGRTRWAQPSTSHKGKEASKGTRSCQCCLFWSKLVSCSDPEKDEAWRTRDGVLNGGKSLPRRPTSTCTVARPKFGTDMALNKVEWTR